MKKALAFTLSVIMIFSLIPCAVFAGESLEESKTAVAVLDSDSNTMTFYYDNENHSSEGLVFSNLNLETYDFDHHVPWTPYVGSIHKIVIDESFSDYKPTVTRFLFSSLGNLTEIDGLDNLNTSETTAMDNMFSDCESLKVLDLTGFDTSKLTSAINMFRDDKNLETIYVDPEKFITDNVTESDKIFGNCQKLVGGAGTAFNASSSGIELARMDGGADAPGYFTGKCELSFDANGHGTAPDPMKIMQGEKLQKPGDPSELGYKFGGWYKEKECLNAWDFENDIFILPTVLYAKWTENAAVNYLSYENSQSVKSSTIYYLPLSGETTELEDCWYIAEGDVSFSDVLVCLGSVRLILLDDCKIEANCGILVNEGSSLSIYSGSKNREVEGTGTLVASNNSDGAGIGSAPIYDSGNITIFGGIVRASSRSGAGIGGGCYGSGLVTINGGTVSASSTDGAGIGGGNSAPGFVTINAGTVSASSNSGAGIGGGAGSASFSVVTINGGSVSASSSNDAGIGSGQPASYKVNAIFTERTKFLTYTSDSESELMVSEIPAGSRSSVMGRGTGKYFYMTEIPSVIPLSSDRLDFGALDAEYASAPAAQTVTLTNNPITSTSVTLPESEYFTISGGEGFVNGVASVGPSGSLSFTVQPKTVLGIGIYNEKLTLTGSHEETAEITLSFTVQDHSWVYTASENVITASCECGKEYKLTLNPSEHVYCGKGVNASYTNGISAATGVNPGEIEYAVKGSDTFSSVSPGKVGEYTVRVTLGGATAYSSLKIINSTAEITVTAKGGKKVYDGAPLTGTVTVSKLPEGYYLAEAATYACITDVNIKGEPVTVDRLEIRNAEGESVTDLLNVRYVETEYLRILPAAITEDMIAPIPDQQHTESEIRPEPNVYFNGNLLTAGTDFTYSYSDNTDIGTAYVTVTGSHNFTGEASVPFSIVKSEAEKQAEADEVVAMIEAIGEVDNSVECLERILRTREAYEALCDGSKEKVPADKLRILTAAEAARIIPDPYCELKVIGKYDGKPVSYRSDLSFEAIAQNCVDLEWIVNGADYTLNADGTITVCDPTGDYSVSFSAKALDGSIIESNTVSVDVRNGIFDKIIAFFTYILNIILSLISF